MRLESGLCQGGAVDCSRLCVPVSFPGDRAGQGGPGARAGEVGGAELREAAPGPPPPRASVVPAEGRTRGCGARAAVSAVGRASGASAGRVDQREAEGAVAAAAATPVRVLSSSRRGRGRLLPPSLPPPSAAAPPPFAARGFLHTSRRGEWGPRASP